MGVEGDTALKFALTRVRVALERRDLDDAWSRLEHARQLADAQSSGDVQMLTIMLREVGVARLESLLAAERWEDAVAFGSEVVDMAAGEAGNDVNHLLNDALFALGADAAMDHYGLVHRSGPVEPVGAGGIVCCLVVRNGRWRLDRYLADMRRLGVERFFVVDHSSTDGTGESLADDGQITVWSTSYSFSRSNCGASFFDVLLRQFAIGAWTLILDLDEDLRIADDLPLPEFCRGLEQRGLRAATGVHIDLYQRSPDEPELYHDREIGASHGPVHMFAGQVPTSSAMRERIFGVPVVVDKAPLQLFTPGLRLCNGQHFTSHPSESTAFGTCAVLHHKFTAGFGERTATIGNDDDNHPSWRSVNLTYSSVSDEWSMYDPEVSVPLGTSADLVALGMLRPLDPLD